MKTPVRIYSFASPDPGPHLLITGAIHGDETCGTKAIEAAVADFHSGKLVLERGTVTFVPICNPLAYEKGQRFVDHNLNRDLRPRTAPVDYEDHLGNILCPLLEKADYLLDLHSYHADGPAFIWAGPVGDKERSFRHAMGTNIELFGWSEAYARISGIKEDTTSVGTTEYARQFGTTGFTLECGSHRDPQSIVVATLALRNALAYLGLVPYPDGSVPVYPLQARVRLESLVRATDQGRFAKTRKHLDPVAKGEVIAFREDGTPLTAETDGYIIFPREGCPVGEEWFYFGVSAPE